MNWEDEDEMIAEAVAFIRNQERQMMEEWLEHIGCKEIVGWSRSAWKREFTLVTKHPGLLIGKAGNNVEYLKKMLKEEFRRDYSIKFVEVSGDFIIPKG